jgi:alpha-L-rhamnosidase
MLDGGATAITESWLGTKDPDKSLSMSHFSLGTVAGWFFEYLGGIRIKDSAPGLSHITLRPYPIKEIGSFAVKYNSRFGEIFTEWHYDGDRPIFSYRLPEGISADIVFPY